MIPIAAAQAIVLDELTVESEQVMELDGVSDKQLQTLERLARELLVIMRQAKLNDALLAESLTQLELEAGKLRRERFDAANTEFHGY